LEGNRGYKNSWSRPVQAKNPLARFAAAALILGAVGVLVVVTALRFIECQTLGESRLAPFSSSKPLANTTSGAID